MFVNGSYIFWIFIAENEVHFKMKYDKKKESQQKWYNEITTHTKNQGGKL